MRGASAYFRPLTSSCNLVLQPAVALMKLAGAKRTQKRETPGAPVAQDLPLGLD